MITKRTVIILFLSVTIFSTANCSAQQNDYIITSQPFPGKDGSIISAEERELIQGLVPYFNAINNKDFQKVKSIRLSQRNLPEEELRVRYANVKFILNGVEDVSYNNGMLKAVIIYIVEFIKPGTAEKNYNWNKCDVILIRQENSWVIGNWFPIENILPANARSIQAMFDMNTKFVKRYGVDDLSKWSGLSTPCAESQPSTAEASARY
ncbi:MAG TPA: hypothetical protein PKA28_10435 [Methylomusa anaerophila]|uniref:DUF4829 domain-containing protein n=1 Tax=Methylomusa anaerophila TaxID=1930071 RepID=A0A348AIT1_9FIRM|nr:hypothetical protein [Methylomusa anaerophila]BBB90979.1 hypothetical protein MAMMFC1_01646 [Methylomusa anaerophila]HML88851.1 hypothetical protein [Methylomusa anaerophila]